MRSLREGRSPWIAAALALLVVAATWTLARGASRPLPRRQLGHDIFYRVPTRRRMVALTFDDGPIPIDTPAVLAILRETGAHATFFLVGRRAIVHPDLVRAIQDAGNEIGNHTWSHPDLTTLLDRQQDDEIRRGADTLAGLGINAVWFRPPYGLISRLGVDDATRIGERTVLWDIAVDHEFRVLGPRAAASMLDRMLPGDIILCHDARPSQFALFRTLFQGLRDRGFAVVTVSELVASAGGT